MGEGEGEGRRGEARRGSVCCDVVITTSMLHLYICMVEKMLKGSGD